METEALERPADLTIWRTTPVPAPAGPACALRHPSRGDRGRRRRPDRPGKAAMDHHGRRRNSLAELDPHLSQLIRYGFCQPTDELF